MAPASCSPWPCCKRGVTSCLSLHLFFALPEGPPGTRRGCDGSTADPCSYGPPGPQPGSIPARAASAVGHRHGLRCSCRVPGSFLVPTTPTTPCTPPPSRVQALSHLPGGMAVSRLSPGPTASHSWTCIESLTHGHTSAIIHSHKC